MNETRTITEKIEKYMPDPEIIRKEQAVAAMAQYYATMAREREIQYSSALESLPAELKSVLKQKIEMGETEGQRDYNKACGFLQAHVYSLAIKFAKAFPTEAQLEVFDKMSGVEQTSIFPEIVAIDNMIYGITLRYAKLLAKDPDAILKMEKKTLEQQGETSLN